MYTKDGILKQSARADSPHNIIPKLIEENSTVLDVGCNAGYLAQQLLAKNVITDGVDIDEDALKQAKKYCRSVYQRDLYKPSLKIPHQQYDFIVFSDILEHLPRPDLVLRDSSQYLASHGKIIASIPNIGRIELRIQHLLGNFDYRPGIMGPDHLRFFVKRTIYELFEQAGYRVQTCLPTGLGYYIKILPTLFAFQFVIVAEKAN